jgi:hypothetical protein
VSLFVDFALVSGLLAAFLVVGVVSRSYWVRISVGCLFMTVGFMFFYGALPSAVMAWTDSWPVIQDNPNFGPRIRDVAIVGYHGVIVGLTFYGFAIWQRLRPVNSDADEAKREAGGYR